MTAADLVPAWPEMAGVAPDIPIGYAPIPGVKRVLREGEIRRIASQLHLAAPAPGEFCIQRRTALVTPEHLLQAMQRTLPDAHISILDYSRVAIPDGTLELPLSGLQKGTGAAFWRGYVVYGGNRRFAIWAKARVTVTAIHAVAAEDLKSGTVIGAANIQVQQRDEFPDSGGFAGSVESVAGLRLRRSVRAGDAIRIEWLDKPKDVTRGDSVRVDAQSGAMHLQLEGQALTSGSAGELITVLNPLTHRRFPARVEAKGRVSAGKEGSL
jgi:flagella basal body P-ring formation protein FlgA